MEGARMRIRRGNGLLRNHARIRLSRELKEDHRCHYKQHLTVVVEVEQHPFSKLSMNDEGEQAKCRQKVMEEVES